MEWFGTRSYFDQREQSSQAMWMDMALARQSGQELINHYIITNSPATAHIRRFFHASIRLLTNRCGTGIQRHPAVRLRPDATGNGYY